MPKKNWPGHPQFVTAAEAAAMLNFKSENTAKFYCDHDGWVTLKQGSRKFYSVESILKTKERLYGHK